MPAARISHLQFCIRPDHLPFYRDLLTSLGWTVFAEWPDMWGFADASGAPRLWFIPARREAPHDSESPGLNHLALAAESMATVDEVTAWLRGRDVPALFATPRHRPDFDMGPGNTYYQVMFRSPDDILLEVVYMGPFGPAFSSQL